VEASFQSLPKKEDTLKNVSHERQVNFQLFEVGFFRTLPTDFAFQSNPA